MRKIRRPGRDKSSDDPLEGLANFFDLGVVFALGLMIIGLARLSPDLLRKVVSDHSVAIPKEAIRLDHYKTSDDQLGGEGEKLGIAYRLKSGEVIYVPEGGK